MILYCSTCRLEMTGAEDSARHQQEYPGHFIGGVVTPALPIKAAEERPPE